MTSLSFPCILTLLNPPGLKRAGERSVIDFSLRSSHSQGTREPRSALMGSTPLRVVLPPGSREEEDLEYV